MESSQQSNIPMPPRPSSNQSENSGQVQMTQPPMTAQGYNQQMAPPSAMYGNKMHQNMMGSSSSHMPPYSSQSSGHYPQSGYHRPSGTMHSYGSQSQSNYPGPSYPGQSSLGGPHRMPRHLSSTPNSSSTSTGSNYNSSQYPSGLPPASGFGMNNMMPPPNQYPNSASMPPPTGGAQAAAQAAVIAAAASSTGLRQSPMYLRQHQQQKMYANSYNSSMGPGAPGSNGGQETPMPPLASTPSSQPMRMNQSSMPPSSASLGNVSSFDGPVPASMVPGSSSSAGFTQTSAPSTLGSTTDAEVSNTMLLFIHNCQDISDVLATARMFGPIMYTADFHPDNPKLFKVVYKNKEDAVTAIDKMALRTDMTAVHLEFMLKSIDDEEKKHRSSQIFNRGYIYGRSIIPDTDFVKLKETLKYIVQCNDLFVIEKNDLMDYQPNNNLIRICEIKNIPICKLFKIKFLLEGRSDFCAGKLHIAIGKNNTFMKIRRHFLGYFGVDFLG